MSFSRSHDAGRIRHQGLTPRAEALEGRALLAAGQIDPSFGVGGTLLTLFNAGSFSSVSDVAMQPDGKFVAAGDVGTRPDFGLARYNADGSVDASFGTNGLVQSHLQLTGTDRLVAEHFASGVALQSDGKIIEAGSITLVENTGGATNVAIDVGLARFDPSGGLDPTFGVGGFVATHFQNQSSQPDVAVQPDGKIVVAAVTTPRNVGSGFSLALARFNPDGSLDPTFGVGGTSITTTASGFSAARPPAIALQAGGKIVVAAQTSPPVSTDSDFVVARFDATGRLDSSFGQDGLVTTHFANPSGAAAVALQPDGRIIAAGFAGNDIALVRYEASGQLDPSFGQGGLVTTPFSAVARASSVILQPDGMIVVAGSGSGGAFGPGGFALARYNATGQLDPSFGLNGITVTQIAANSVRAPRAFVQPDGKIMLVGGARADTLAQVAFARYLGQAAPSPPANSTGPTVTGLARLGFHRQPTTLVVAFSAAMDPARATNLANYRLNRVIHPHGPRGGHLGRMISLAVATYDAATHSVDLFPAPRLPLRFTYQLTVVGTPPNGLTDASGAYLAGAGTAGTDYVATFDRSALVLPARTAAAAVHRPQAKAAAKVEGGRR